MDTNVKNERQFMFWGGEVCVYDSPTHGEQEKCLMGHCCTLCVCVCVCVCVCAYVCVYVCVCMFAQAD